MERAIENIRVTNLLTQALDNTNVTSRYLPMECVDEVSFIVGVGAQADSKATTVEIYQAKDAAGTSAKKLKENDGSTDWSMGQTIAKAAGFSGDAISVDVENMVNDQEIEINDVTFTKKAATDVDENEFADAAGLVLCIASALENEAKGTAATHVVTIERLENADLVSIAGTTSTVVVAGVRSTLLASVKAEYMDTNNDFTHLAVKVTTTATTTVNVTALQSGLGTPANNRAIETELLSY